MKNFSPATLLPLFLSLACSANPQSSQVKAEEEKTVDESGTLGLGMNDVAILMPLNTLPELKKHLPKLLDAPSPGEGFVPAWFNDYTVKAGVSSKELGEKAKLMMPLVMHLNKVKDEKGFESLVANGPASDAYTLVSLRLDPCTNGLQVKENAECVRELRLVWQILEDKEDLESPVTDRKDGNVHTLYTLNQDEFADIIASLKKLHKEASVETREMPLLPHPVIEKEGVDSPYLKGVLSIVNTYARASKLSEIAVMKVSSSNDAWNFMHIAVENQDPKPFSIAGSKSFDGSPSFAQTFSDIANDGALNGGNSADLLTHSFVMPRIIESLRGPGRLPSYEEKMKLFEQKLTSANAVNNPSLHNPKNVDCVSCHITDKQEQQYRSFIGRDFIAENNPPALESFLEYRYKSDKWNLTQAFPNNGGKTSSVQNFSFLAGSMNSPVITQRVINDAAHTLTFLEEHPEVMQPAVK